MGYSQLPYWLALSYLPTIGARRILGWFKRCPDIKSIVEHPNSLSFIDKEKVPLFQAIDWKQVESDLAWLNKSSQHFITCYEDSFYPKILKEITDPPLILFGQGNPHLLNTNQLAIVGTRKASLTGLKTARDFAYALVQKRFTVTSGLALGIDGAAHQGALLAQTGLTIGVAGTGLQHVYPAKHRALVHQIIDKGGAIISEFPLAALPKANHFPRRNRIIAGLSLGTLIVEAELKSGSLITAYLALEQGREVFAIPGSIHHPLSKGCHHLIRQGAKLTETVEDITEELDFQQAYVRQAPMNVSDNNEKMSLKEETVFQYIEREVISIDALVLHSGLTISEISSMLLTLELRGFIASVPGGYVRL